MHINQISYQKTFNLGNYSSERIGVEIVINEGEDAKEALNTAKALVEEYHKQSANDLPQCLQYAFPEPSTTDPLPTIQTSEQLPEWREQTLEEQIRSCTDITVLN